MESLAVSAVLEEMKVAMKLVEDARLERGLERLKRENPDDLLEALTEQQRAALIQEDRVIERKLLEEYSKQLEADIEIEASESDLPEETDPNEDGSEQGYANYRKHWEFAWGRRFGSFDDTTPIPPMAFTDNPLPRYTDHADSLQIYGIKIDTGLECAVEVFGSIAMRDKLDHNRNIIFERTRDNCQVVTAQKQDLLLTGPTRAAVYGPVYFDGILKVKGRTEAEDKDICYLAMKYDLDESMNSFPYKFYSSKLSILRMTCGLVPSSVEATIAMRVVDGSWPSDLPCMITAHSITGDRTTAHSITGDCTELILLDSEDAVANIDGSVQLSRHVVSVESSGMLRVFVLQRRRPHINKLVMLNTVSFIPMEAGRSNDILDVGFCKIEVTVAWSLFLTYYPSNGFPPSCLQ